MTFCLQMSFILLSFFRYTMMLHINKCGISLCDYFENSLLSFLTFCVLSLYPTCYILRWSDSSDSKFEYAVCEDILRSNRIMRCFVSLSEILFKKDIELLVIMKNNIYFRPIICFCYMITCLQIIKTYFQCYYERRSLQSQKRVSRFIEEVPFAHMYVMCIDSPFISVCAIYLRRFFHS